jgi:hypothetical protein
MLTKKPTKPEEAVRARGQVPMFYVDRDGEICYPDCLFAATNTWVAEESLQLSPEQEQMADGFIATHTAASSPSEATPGITVTDMVNGYIFSHFGPFMDCTY